MFKNRKKKEVKLSEFLKMLYKFIPAVLKK